MSAIYRSILFVTIACILFGVWTSAFQTFFPDFNFFNQFLDQYEDQIADENVSQSNRCAPETAWACTVQQLCDRATFGSPKRWQTWEAEQGYVTYAKQQDVGCGVVEQAAPTTTDSSSSSNQCSPTNAADCTIEQLCSRAAYGSPKQWRTDLSRLSYVEEAKRHSLTCGLVEQAATSTTDSIGSSNQCSPTNAADCTIEQLCSRAAYGEPKQWREWGVLQNYADEAKRRGLTCGVVEQAATSTTGSIGSSNQCLLSDVSACSTSHLCARGTYGSPKQWRTDLPWLSYVEEAKRRGLTCGVVEQAATSTTDSIGSSNQCSPTNAADCTIEQLCSRAAYGEPKQWREWGVLQNYADEAKRRGLTCGVVEQAPECTPSNVSACSSEQLCERGTYGTPLRWYERISWSEYADEAKRRGLTCGVLSEATPSRTTPPVAYSGCSSFNLGSCTVHQLCNRATFGDPKRWFSRGNIARYAGEARRRGLTCGVVEQAAPTTTDSSSSSNQCSWKETGACSTEQLCRLGTFGPPLRWYESSNLVKFSNEARRRGLTCGVLSEATPSRTTPPAAYSGCSSVHPGMCTNQRLCQLATYGNPKRWFTGGTALSFAKEAIRRGLDCGV